MTAIDFSKLIVTGDCAGPEPMVLRAAREEFDGHDVGEARGSIRAGDQLEYFTEQPYGRVTACSTGLPAATASSASRA